MGQALPNLPHHYFRVSLIMDMACGSELFRDGFKVWTSLMKLGNQAVNLFLFLNTVYATWKPFALWFIIASSFLYALASRRSMSVTLLFHLFMGKSQLAITRWSRSAKTKLTAGQLCWKWLCVLFLFLKPLTLKLLWSTFSPPTPLLQCSAQPMVIS